MEEHFKNKLEGHKVEWDKKELLGGLQEELASAKSKRSLWWFLLLPVLFVGTCVGWNTLPSHAGQPSASAVVNNTEAPLSATLIEDPLQVREEKATFENDFPINTTHKNIDTESLSARPIKNNAHVTNQNSISKSANVRDKEQPSASFQTVNSREKIQINQVNQSTKKPISVEAINPEDWKKSTIQVHAENSIDNSTIQEKAVISIENSRAGVIQRLDLPFSSKNRASATESQNQLIENRIPVAFLPIETLGPAPLIMTDEIAWMADLHIPVPSPRPDSDRSKNAFYLMGSSEIGLVSGNRIFNTENAEYRLRLENNANTERSLAFLSTNLYLGYQHRSNLSLQSGFEYSQIKEVFNYNESTSSTVEKPTDEVNYTITNQGSTTIVYDTILVIRTEDRSIRHYNTHTFYTIPVQLGYSFNWGEMKFVTRLGLSYTIANNFKGKLNYVPEQGESIILENFEEIRFELKNKMGLYAGLGIEHPITRNSQVFAQVNYRRSPRLLFVLAKHRYSSISLGLGVKYDINAN